MATHASPPHRMVPPRVELVETLERIYGYRMTTTSGGNLSIRDEDGGIWITPARVDKGALRPQDVVHMAPDGSTRGLHPPSSELPFHRSIYAARPDLRAIVHAHPVALVAFSIIGKVPDVAVLPHARQVCSPVGFAEYRLPGSEALGAVIARSFSGGANSVILENHGVVVGGVDLRQAFERFETLEFTAKTLVKAAILGAVRPLSEERLHLAEQWADLASRAPAGERLSAVAPPVDVSLTEREARYTLAEFVRRGYRQRLFASTEGSFSARIGPDAFVITAFGMDRKTCAPEELVRVSGDRFEAGKSPSRAVFMHRAIYRRDPKVQSVVNAMPVNATAFSCSAERLNSRTIPESYLFLQDVPVIPFEHPYRRAAEIAETVNTRRPVALLENNGALVAGKSILDAFDRLEVLEATAEAIINARHVGTLRVMDDARIGELRTAFAAMLG